MRWWLDSRQTQKINKAVSEWYREVLVFTDGEKWRLLIVFLSHGAADTTLDRGL